jgi:hypothetical protein
VSQPGVAWARAPCYKPRPWAEGVKRKMRFFSLFRAAPAVALAALAGGLGGCVSTTTYGAGQSPEATLLSEATGGVFDKLNRKEDPQIDYEPRAALVIPPSAQLPQPAPAPSELAAGAWPVEEQNAEEQRLAGSNPDTRAMSPDYVRRMRPFGQFSNNDRGERVRMRETGAAQAFASDPTRGQQRAQFQAALAEADGLQRTERRFLTDPPTHVRQPAESAPAQFDDIERRKSGNFFSRLFGG